MKTRLGLWWNRKDFLKTLFLGLALMWMCESARAASAVVSSLSSAPTTDAVLSQTTYISTGITARYTSTSDFRSITQTFTLGSDTALTGIALMLAPNQNSVAGTVFSASQDYALDIQVLNSSNKVVETVETYTFTLTTSLIAANNWLYIQFSLPTAYSELLSGVTYGFNLRPTSIVANNNVVLAISSSSDDTIYPDGIANQYGTAGLIAAGTSYGNAGSIGDFVFVLTSTAIPEPGVCELLIGGMLGLAGIRAFAARKRFILGKSQTCV